MNEKLKELAVQAGLSREFSVSGLWLADDEELKRFADLVRQDYLRELKALKPVAWMLPEYGDVISARNTDDEGIYNIPLFALDEVTK